jgi:hypothetical protein
MSRYGITGISARSKATKEARAPPRRAELIRSRPELLADQRVQGVLRVAKIRGDRVGLLGEALRR